MSEGTGFKLRGLERAFVAGPLKAWLVRTLEAPTLFRNVHSLENAHVLEIGAGRGLGTLALLHHFPTARPVVSDFDPTMLEEAHAFLERAGVGSRVESFRHADAKALPFPDASFDATIAFEAFHHVQGYAAAIHELSRVTHTGGLLLAADVIRPPWAPRWVSVNLPDGILSAGELAQLLKESGFVIEHWRGIPNLWAAVIAWKSTVGH